MGIFQTNQKKMLLVASPWDTDTSRRRKKVMAPTRGGLPTNKVSKTQTGSLAAPTGTLKVPFLRDGVVGGASRRGPMFPAGIFG